MITQYVRYWDKNTDMESVSLFFDRLSQPYLVSLYVQYRRDLGKRHLVGLPLFVAMLRNLKHKKKSIINENRTGTSSK